MSNEVSKIIVYAESHWRSLLKGFSWRIWGTLVSIIVTYILLREWNIALKIGAIEFVSKVLLYYVHERLWSFVPWWLEPKKL